MAKDRRIVAIGDLNGAHDALLEILRGTKLIDARGSWSGGAAELVQVGDLFNRGDGARAALTLLLKLRREAAARGGKVTVLLGNHEVMTALGNEAYCTVGEYLSFAPARAQEAWPGRVFRAMMRLYRGGPDGAPIPPLAPRVEVWKIENAPGRKEMRRALGPRGALGRELRRLPVAHKSGDLLFVHAGLTPAWAEAGLDALNDAAREAWDESETLRDAPRHNVFRDEEGPLWDRSLAQGKGAGTQRALARALSLVGARRMVIGHTNTAQLPGGERGEILTRFGGRLVCIDVGITSGPGAPRAALLVEGEAGYQWSPAGLRPLW
jgi:hypothetical protein